MGCNGDDGTGGDDGVELAFFVRFVCGFGISEDRLVPCVLLTILITLRVCMSI